MSGASLPLPPLAGAAPLFAALGDETRLALVARLGTGRPLSITELARGAPVTRQAIAKHLNILAGAGLVRDRRRGREHLWELEVQRLDDARRYLDEISKCWDEALDRLKQFVEE
jgi:DNA-binding transcriptional ArsR family regulator